MRNDLVTIVLNGRPVEAPAGISVAAAVIAAGQLGFRRSVSGELRGPLCGMGICFECRLTIDGRTHETSCQVPLRAGMVVNTDA